MTAVDAITAFALAFLGVWAGCVAVWIAFEWASYPRARTRTVAAIGAAFAALSASTLAVAYAVLNMGAGL